MKLIAFLASGGVAIACSCGTITPEGAFTGSDVVFSGTAESIEALSPTNGWPSVKVAFRAREMWKGTNTSLVVYTAANGSLCGYTFVRGTNYLVYAQEQKSRAGERILMTTLCSRTCPLSEAAEDLRFLKSPR